MPDATECLQAIGEWLGDARLTIAILIAVALWLAYSLGRRRVAAHDLPVQVTAENWREVVGQLIADATREVVAVEELVDLQISPRPKMVFRLAGGRECTVQRASVLGRMDDGTIAALWRLCCDQKLHISRGAQWKFTLSQKTISTLQPEQPIRDIGFRQIDRARRTGSVNAHKTAMPWPDTRPQPEKGACAVGTLVHRTSEAQQVMDVNR